MPLIYLKPAKEGLVVRHPQKMQYVLPAKGEWVMDSMHWRRMVKQGDVVEVDPPVVEKKETEKAIKPPKAKVAEKEVVNNLNGGE